MAGRARTRNGFTLIEVLVALVVLGAIATASIALIGQNTRYIASAEDRLLAAIVADNATVEALSVAVLERGETETEIEFGGASWVYARKVIDPGVEGLSRIDIAVRRAGGTQTLARVTTLRAEEPPPGAPSPIGRN